MTPAGKPKRYVLVVDDQPLMHVMLTQILKDLGFNHVLTANNGKTAWNLLCHEPICLVLTDINMPDLNGLELIALIRNHQSTQDLPVVAVSGECTPEIVRETVQTGADAFVVKPFCAASIKQKIVSALQRYGDRLACPSHVVPPHSKG